MLRLLLTSVLLGLVLAGLAPKRTSLRFHAVEQGSQELEGCRDICGRTPSGLKSLELESLCRCRGFNVLMRHIRAFFDELSSWREPNRRRRALIDPGLDGHVQDVDKLSSSRAGRSRRALIDPGLDGNLRYYSDDKPRPRRRRTRRRKGRKTQRSWRDTQYI